MTVRIIPPTPHLSPRQAQVKDLTDKGVAVKEIAAQLGISIKSVYLYRCTTRRVLARPPAMPRVKEVRPAKVERSVERCPRCHLILPCRDNGQRGPCDAREDAFTKLEAVRALRCAIRTQKENPWAG